MCHVAKPCQDKSSSASRLSSCSPFDGEALLMQRCGLEKVGEVHCAGEYSGSVVSQSTPSDLLLVQLQSCSGVKIVFGALRRSSTWVSTKTAFARRFWPLGPLMPRSVPELLSLPPLWR